MTHKTRFVPHAAPMLCLPPSLALFGFLLATPGLGQLPLVDWQSVLLDQNSPGVGFSPSTDDFFGEAVATGDFDCDGFDDLAVSAPGEFRFVPPQTFDRQVGVVHVVFGGPEGLTDRSTTLQQDDLGSQADGREAFDRFGSTLAAGNFDGDAFNDRPCDDLVIGAPDEGVVDDEFQIERQAAGQVWVLYGGPDSILVEGSDPAITTLHLDQSGVTGTVAAHDRFGSALAVGDFDDDGHDDLAIGASGYSGDGVLDSGGVWVFSGGPNGLDQFTGGWQQLLTQDTPGIVDESELNDSFGLRLAVCDVDGDQFDDLILGTPLEDVELATTFTNAGSVTVIFGSAGGIAAPLVSERFRTGVAQAEFGDALSVGYFFPNEGPPRCQIAVGAPPVGEVSVIESLGGDLTPIVTWDEQGLGGPVGESNFFGLGLGAADLDLDGLDEVLIGAPFELVDGLANAGTFYWVRPGATGLAPEAQKFGPGSWPGGALGGLFGVRFASGDLDGDGRGDLVVSAITQDNEVLSDNAGQVRALFSQNGLANTIFTDGFESGDTAGWSASLP